MVALAAEATDCAVGWGRCLEIEAMPYWPWRQAVAARRRRRAALAQRARSENADLMVFTLSIGKADATGTMAQGYLAYPAVHVDGYDSDESACTTSRTR